MSLPPAASATAEFPVAWDDPSHAELTWERDDMHMPHAVAPLTADYIVVVGQGYGYCALRFDAPLEFIGRVWNGYAYFTMRRDWPADEAAAQTARNALIERHRGQIATIGSYWTDRAVPELRAMRARFRSAPVEGVPGQGLAATWNEFWQLAERAWSIHFYAIIGPYQVMEDLADLYETVVKDAPAGESMRLIQGGNDELQAVERDLERLTASAAAQPEIRARLIQPPVPALAEIEAIPGGATFAGELHGFLEQHGHLGGSFDDLAFPSWIEEPGIVLADIGRRLEHPGPSAAERRARLAREADELADRLRTTLAEQPEELAKFEGLLLAARAVGPLTETHNYWIDRLTQSCLRSFVLRVGAWLVEAGALASADDILFLGRSEVPELLVAPSDRRELVAERRADLARRSTITPPRYLGKLPDDPNPGTVDRFEGSRFAPTEDGVLRGTGASAGVVRGTARVVLGPADFGRVRPGDIIVAPSSNPSWVPLFTMAGGLLTNTGGALSHAAVVAREFGLPAVVGLGDATTRILDGSTVELDGTTGSVRIL